MGKEADMREDKRVMEVVRVVTAEVNSREAMVAHHNKAAMEVSNKVVMVARRNRADMEVEGMVSSRVVAMEEMRDEMRDMVSKVVVTASRVADMVGNKEVDTADHKAVGMVVNREVVTVDNKAVAMVDKKNDTKVAMKAVTRVVMRVVKKRNTTVKEAAEALAMETAKVKVRVTEVVVTRAEVEATHLVARPLAMPHNMLAATDQRSPIFSRQPCPSSEETNRRSRTKIWTRTE